MKTVCCVNKSAKKKMPTQHKDNREKCRVSEVKKSLTPADWKETI